MGLALAQVSFYRVTSRQALQSFWVLVLFYLLIFYFVKGLEIFCVLFSIPFYEIPFFTVTLFIVFGRGIKGLAHFQKVNSQIPDFYLLSGLWIGLLWLGSFSQVSLFEGLAQSLFGAFFFLILTGIKERLEILDTPMGFKGLPALLISAGTFLLTFLFLIHFRN